MTGSGPDRSTTARRQHRTTAAVTALLLLLQATVQQLWRVAQHVQEVVHHYTRRGLHRDGRAAVTSSRAVASTPTGAEGKVGGRAHGGVPRRLGRGRHVAVVHARCGVEEEGTVNRRRVLQTKLREPLLLRLLLLHGAH